MESKDQLLIDQMTSYKANSERLMTEGFKAETVLKMMNNCAEKCSLQYKESGIANKKDEQVNCFVNCASKSYKLSKLSLS